MKLKSNIVTLVSNPLIAAFAAVVLQSVAAGAQQAEPRTAWQREKCALFEQSWADALEFFGSDNVNYNFLARNENFIASNCADPTQVCPRSTKEIDIADAITIQLMNAGAASSFLPFRCQTIN